MTLLTQNTEEWKYGKWRRKPSHTLQQHDMSKNTKEEHRLQM